VGCNITGERSGVQMIPEQGKQDGLVKYSNGHTVNPQSFTEDDFYESEVSFDELLNTIKEHTQNTSVGYIMGELRIKELVQLILSKYRITKR